MGHDPQRSGRTILLGCWEGYVLLVVFLAGLACAGLTTALAAEGPPDEPILRLETGMHTALIRRIGVDAAGRMLLTVSDDKTARLWSLQDGRLLKVLRPPVGTGNEGKLYAGALSPDGRMAAVTGWTGWDWEGSASIYLFDTTSGRLLRRLRGLPDVIY